MPAAETTSSERRSFTEQDIARCRALLAEESAVLVSLERGTWRRKLRSSGNFEDVAWVRMLRKWPRISDGDRAMCEEFLARFASAKNAVAVPPATEPASCDTVENPKTDREKFSGTWRMRKTALSPLHTDSAQQGVYQTLMWPADFDGDVGDMCAESSPLHHEDVSVFFEASEPPSCNHEISAGHIYRVNANVDGDTGLWNGQSVDDIARDPGLYGTWSKSAERVTLRIRGEHRASPFIPMSGGLTDSAARSIANSFISGFPGRLPDLSHPIIVTNADMDAYGLFSVTAELSWPIPSIVPVVADQQRFTDVEVEFSSQESLPTMASMTATGGPLHGHSVASATLLAYAIVPSLSARMDEFGLLNGHVTWRIPKGFTKGWVKVGYDEEAPVWKKWGWNQVESSDTTSGILPGTSTGTLKVTTSPVASVWTATNGSFSVTSASGVAVTVPAGTYSISFPTVEGQTITATITGVSVSAGENVERTATREYSAGSINNPFVVEAIDFENRTIELDYASEGSFDDILIEDDYYVLGENMESAGKVYLAVVNDEIELVEVDPNAVEAASGTANDPIHVAEINSDLNKVKLYEEDNGTEVVSSSWTSVSNGCYYVLWEGDGAGTLYVAASGVLSAVTSSASAFDVSVGVSAPNNLPSIFTTGSDGFQTIAGIGGDFSSDAYIFEKQVAMDWNEYGLVDYVITVQGEKNPYYGTNGDGIRWSSESGEGRYRFIPNHTNSHASSNTGFVYLILSFTTTWIRGFKSVSAATGAATTAVQNSPNSHRTSAHVQKHGHWWVVVVEDTSHSRSR